MSSPSSPALQALAHLGFLGLARRALPRASRPPRARGTTHTPSSSATITSPGLTSAPPHTTGTLTLPSVSLTVPCADTRLRPDREAHRGQLAHVAHAGVDDRARARRARRARSPAARRNSRRPNTRWARRPGCRPAWHCSTATWIIQLSAGATLTVTAEPAMRAPAVDRAAASGASRPVRPCASCTVATPQRARPSTTAGSARRIFVYTTFMAATLQRMTRPIVRPCPRARVIAIHGRV